MQAISRELVVYKADWLTSVMVPITSPSFSRAVWHVFEFPGNIFSPQIVGSCPDYRTRFEMAHVYLFQEQRWEEGGFMLLKNLV